MEQAIETTPAPAAAPDWAATGEDLHCPLCDYNLRGLVDPVCPECGYRFEWAELTDPARRKHPYLFEHHPGRNVWSFWKTAWGGLRPRQFWASLSPAMPSRPRRLVLYWGVTAFAALLAVAGLYYAEWLRIGTTFTALPVFGGGRATYINLFTNKFVTGPTNASPLTPVVPFGDFWAYAGPGYLIALACACAWPWLTFLSLLVFRISMRRARIRPTHVLRCVVYSGDALFWAALTVFTLSAAAAGAIWAGTGRAELLPADVPWVAASFVPVLAAYRLGVAYQRYLRFDHPWATVFASQLMAGLLALAILPQAWLPPLYW